MNGDGLDVAAEAVLAAEVEHLLGLGDAAVVGAGQPSTRRNEAEGADG